MVSDTFEATLRSLGCKLNLDKTETMGRNSRKSIKLLGSKLAYDKNKAINDAIDSFRYSLTHGRNKRLNKLPISQRMMEIDKLE
jgi:hypothetical protein